MDLKFEFEMLEVPNIFSLSMGGEEQKRRIRTHKQAQMNATIFNRNFEMGRTGEIAPQPPLHVCTPEIGSPPFFLPPFGMKNFE